MNRLVVCNCGRLAYVTEHYFGGLTILVCNCIPEKPLPDMYGPGVSLWRELEECENAAIKECKESK